jgi:hypothetical protein
MAWITPRGVALGALDQPSGNLNGEGPRHAIPLYEFPVYDVGIPREQSYYLARLLTGRRMDETEGLQFLSPREFIENPEPYREAWLAWRRHRQSEPAFDETADDVLPVVPQVASSEAVKRVASLARDFIALEGEAAPTADQWDWVRENRLAIALTDDSATSLLRGSAVRARIEPYHGARFQLVFPKSRQARWEANSRNGLRFFVKADNPNRPGFQFVNPVVTLHETQAKFVRLTPTRDFLNHPGANAIGEGWILIVVPFQGDSDWKREGDVSQINWVTIGVDSWGGEPLTLWVDGLKWE